MLTLVAVAGCDERPTQRQPVVGPEWKPAEESVVLPTGLKAHATYHFNRNALSAACVTDEAVLAVTDSGNLLRFDLKDLRLRQEARPEAAITLLAQADGVGILAACADGRVFRIDPGTLKQTEFARLRAAPRWMAGFLDAPTQKRGVLAAVVSSDKGHGDETIELHRLGLERPGPEQHKVPPPPISNAKLSAFLLDRKSRLWLGKDMGEWGGWCGSLDVSAGPAGRVEALKDASPEGVYGFVELPDGQVWAFGGMMHFLSSGFIARVDRGKWEVLGSYEGDRQAKPDSTPKRPRYPITHVVPDPQGDGLLVFAYRDLFRVDAELKTWRHLGTIELRYRPGRPDAMGSYPALRAVRAVGDKSGDLIGTSARDGLLRIREGRVTQYVVPGQIGDDRIDTILPAAGASVLGGAGLWRYGGGGWQATSVFPPSPPDRGESWYEYRVMLDPDRLPVALCRSNSTPGTAALTRWKDGRVEVIASERGPGVTFSARGGFATPDGGYWCAAHEKLLRLEGGRWQQAGKAPDQPLWGLRVVGQDKPPWILHCDGSLYHLAPGKGARDAALTPVPLPAELGTIRDALALESGQILLACAAGLRLFDEDSGKVSACPFAPPKGDVWALCRDGRGRRWLAGSGVWMVDAKGTVHDLGKLQRYGVMAQAIGADSADATGVIVALGHRGVLLVRVEDADR
jgi:hypothetical protein